MIFFRIIHFILIMVIIWGVGFAWFVDKISMAEPVINEKTDAIIVLTGAKGRIDAGLKLLSEKYAPHMFVSGVGQDAVLGDLSLYLSSFTPKQVEKLKSSITLGHAANSTKENAIETAEWLKKNHYKKIILVTSNYHMIRSLYLFEQLIPDVKIIAYPVKSQINMNLVFLEYNKYLLHRIKS